MVQSLPLHWDDDTILLPVIRDEKTVYRDIARLRDYGLKIEQIRGGTPGYYVEEP